MIPKASNQANTKREFNTANKLSSLLAPIDIDMRIVAFFVSTLPANSQLRLCDLIMEYVSMAKESEHESIAMWANSLSIDS